MINGIFKEKITESYNDLEEQYKLLDIILSGRTYLLPYLDNERNLYAYSSRLVLLDGMKMMIKGNSAYSEMDIVNRIIHYVALQYDLFSSINEHKGFGLIAYTDPEVIKIIDRIKVLLLQTVHIVTLNIPIKTLPVYIASWLSKYSILRINEQELKHSKTIIENLEVV